MWGVPTLVLIALYVILDPMKVMRYHDDMMPDGFIPNKGNITVKYFEHYMPEYQYDSFLLGSSLTIHHWVDDWKDYLPVGARPFHFDSSGMTILQMRRALEYLTSHADVKNIFMVIPSFAVTWLDTNDVPWITPAEWEEPLSEKLYIHYQFFKKALDRKFINTYLCKVLIDDEPAGTGDFFWSHDVDYFKPEINEEKSLKTNLRLDKEAELFEKEFPGWEQRTDTIRIATYRPHLKDENIENLKAIAKILHDKQISYKFVVAPVHINEVINPVDDRILSDIFGDNYYNLSHELSYTTLNPSMWYDQALHYRQDVARQIMEVVYKDSIK